MSILHSNSLLCLLAVLTGCAAAQSPVATATPRGVPSGDTENDGGERDPSPPRLLVPLAAHPRGEQLMAAAGSALASRPLQVPVRSGTKYGSGPGTELKASAGAFVVRLGRPEASLRDGVMVLRAPIEDLTVPGIHVRARAPGAERFGAKILVAGGARDAWLELSLAPLLDPVDGHVADAGRIAATCSIGRLDLTGLPPGTDAAARALLEDALACQCSGARDDRGSYVVLASLVRGIEDELGVAMVRTAAVPAAPGASAMETFDARRMQSAFELALERTMAQMGDGLLERLQAQAAARGLPAVASLGAARVASDAPPPSLPGAAVVAATASDEAPAANGEAAPAPAVDPGYELTPNAELQGRLGRLVVQWPQANDATGTYTRVLRGNESAADGWGNKDFELLPGQISVAVNNQTVGPVPVKSGHDTRVKVGLLQVTASKNTNVLVLDAKGEKRLADSWGSKSFGLPVGTYQVDIAGQKETVVVRDGQVTKF